MTATFPNKSCPTTSELGQSLQTPLSSKAAVLDREATNVKAETCSPPESWPPFVPLIKSFPSNSLLAGTEPLIWRALGTMASQLENLSKQVAIQQALNSIHLGWVANNTTPFQIVVGKLYDHALAQARQMKLNLDKEQIGMNKRIKYTKIPVNGVEISTMTIPSNPAIQRPLVVDNKPQLSTKEQ